MLKASADDAATVSRLHPAIDVRAAGDLLARAGFSMPVADNDSVSVTYRTPMQRIHDIRANGLSNVLTHRAALSPMAYRKLARSLANGPQDEKFALIYLTGWSPDAG